MLEKIQNLTSNFKPKDVVKKVIAELEKSNFEVDIQTQINEIKIQRKKIFNQIFNAVGRGASVILEKVLDKKQSQFSRYRLQTGFDVPEEVMWRLQYYFHNVPLSCFLLDSQIQAINNDIYKQELLEGLVINHLNLLDIAKDFPAFTENVETFFPTLIKRFNFDLTNYQQILGVRQNINEIKFIISNDDLFAPDINKGDLVFFDLAHGKFTGDGVYLMAFDNTLLIRRVQKISSSQYQLSCNDNRYSAIKHQATDLFFVGKVFRSLQISNSKNIS